MAAKREGMGASVKREALLSTAQLANAAGGGQGRILAVFDWLADWVGSPAFHGCLFIKAASEYPVATDRPRQAAEAFKAGCRALLEEQCQELGIADPSRLAGQLHLLLEGALVLSFLERDPRAAQAAREAAVVLISAAATG